MSVLAEAISYLQANTLESAFVLFAMVVIFEIPRYFGMFAVAALFERPSPRRSPPREDSFRLSVIISGHNERESLHRCVRVLNEQSRPPDEIVLFSDGSSDGSDAAVMDMLRRGEVDHAYCSDLRGGKAAGVNACFRLATGDIIVNIDCDCTLDRHSLANIVAPFVDRQVGAVCGNIQVRNGTSTLLTAFQSIEYLVSFSLGKQAAQMIGQVTNASGGYAAFRRSAWVQVGGNDAGGGEDFDFTLRLRMAGWKIAFKADAICYTDVPDTIRSLTNQRLRWERDAISLRYRKHSYLLNPFDRRFSLSECFHQIEFLIFNVIGAALLPVYVVWLFLTYGSFAIPILIAVQLVMMTLDVAALLLAAHATPHSRIWPNLPYVFGFSLYNGLYMRALRLFAYLQEWFLLASFRDSYVPQKVHDARSV